MVSHLRFALRHEPVDLGVLAAALKTIEAADIEAWVRAEPTGAFSRRAWFFHEMVTGRTLDLEDAGAGNYVEALDPNRHIVAELRTVPDLDPTDKAVLVRLQGDIVDRRYAASDWRRFQNFVGATVGGYREEAHFICPRPEDVPGLMDAWMALTRRVVEGGVDPVAAAAVSAFAFVFIHPFEDGNGTLRSRSSIIRSTSPAGPS